jgi:hypothetical protein
MIGSCKQATLSILRACAAILSLALAGCVSYSYVDDHNVQHVVGFVHVAIDRGHGAAAGSTPTAVSVTGIGLSAYTDPINGNGVILGYGKEVFLTIPNNSCIDLDPAGPCSKSNPSATTVNTREKRQ